MKSSKQKEEYTSLFVICALLFIAIGLAIPLVKIMYLNSIDISDKESLSDMSYDNAEKNRQFQFLEQEPEHEYDIFGVRKKSTTGTVKNVEDDTAEIDTIGNDTYFVSVSDNTYVTIVLYENHNGISVPVSVENKSDFSVSDLNLGDIVRFSFTLDGSNKVVADEITLL